MYHCEFPHIPNSLNDFMGNIEFCCVNDLLRQLDELALGHFGGPHSVDMIDVRRVWSKVWKEEHAIDFGSISLPLLESHHVLADI